MRLALLIIALAPAVPALAPDMWRTTDRLTVDDGARFLRYTPWWRPDRRSANVNPALYDPSKAARLYQPAVIDGRRGPIGTRRVDFATGER